MIYLYTALIVALSATLWRIRGGWHKEIIPANKVWYAVAFAIYGCILFSFSADIAIIGFVACYISYQLYGWGLYVGRLLTGAPIDPELDRECELIDDLLMPLHITLKGQKYYLYQYPKVFGFVGTCLTGLIITFLWGTFLIDVPITLSGLGMGLCYWLGGKTEPYLPLGKNGWNWGEIYFGLYEGAILAWRLLW